MEPLYDCIVIGAGIEGSATAYQLSRFGQRTLLLEQFQLLHQNGSSHGASRIIRRAYEPECYAALMEEAYEEWDNIQKLSGKKLYVKTGLVYFGKRGSEEIQSVTTNLQKYNASFRTLDHLQLMTAIPNSVYSSEYSGAFDEMGGVLLANEALAAIQDLILHQGGEIRDDCKVTLLHPGEIIAVDTSQGQFKAKSVALCPGTWIGTFASQLKLKLPIQPQRSFVLYWKEKEENSYSAASGMPCLIDAYNEIYALPSLENPGYMKLCNHGGYDFIIENPDVHEEKPPYNLKYACEYVRDHFPLLEPTPTIIQKCKYSITPDEICILDGHPHHPNIIIAAGFSGTGFKIAPVIGNIIKDLVLGSTPKYDMKPFRLGRF